MTIPLPQSLPATSSWQLADWIDRTYSSAPASGGIALITLDQLPDYERWQLTHMVAGCTSSSTTAMRLYLDAVSNTQLRDGTSAGNFDVADWPAGLMVPPNRSLIARWTGCADGAVATLTVQANVLRRTS